MLLRTVSRRQFLVGAGGFTLALPWLPSLLDGSARAQDHAQPRRFIALATHHGGIWAENMFPKASKPTATQSLGGGHEARRYALSLAQASGRASLSPVLSASSSRLTPALAAKMNVLRGLDVSFYLGHHTGGHLGNYAHADRAAGDSDFVRLVGGEVPTIDQVMAFSPSFYGKAELATTRQRSLHVGGGNQKCIAFRRIGDRVDPVPGASRALELFRAVFVPEQSTAPEVDPRPRVVDRVLESYKRLTEGAYGEARRISSDDRKRLDAHLTALSELERSLSAGRSGVRASGCSTVMPPSGEPREVGGDENGNDVAATRAYYRAFNDVIVAAIRCGSSRIATVYSNQLWSSYSEDWHQQVVHGGDNPDNQRLILDANRGFFEEVFLDLVEKLDVEEVDGKTYLDSTLVQWTQESGSSTHNPISIPVVTAGSAGGFLQTGLYCDYRNDAAPRPDGTPGKSWEDQKVGILYNQWLATALSAMGIPKSEYRKGQPEGHRGYGSTYRQNYYGTGTTLYPDRLIELADSVVPFLARSA